MITNKKIEKIVVLTGAGISAESGIRTFRGQDGLWEGHRIEEVASPEGFRENPELVHDFYNQRRRQLLSSEVKPNRAHLALAEFEQKFPGQFLIVTQNVDNLHERAGSKNILHMHGELLKVRCLHTGKILDWKGDLTPVTLHQHSNGMGEGKGCLRPHIVWFGEMPLCMDLIETALEEADLFVSIGTSGNVYPAAGFVSWCQPQCVKVELNLEGTMQGRYFNQSIYGQATKIVEEFFLNLGY